MGVLLRVKAKKKKNSEQNQSKRQGKSSVNAVELL